MRRGTDDRRGWCEGHLQAVAQVGIHQGTHFDFGTARAAIEWPEFAADSEFERPIILAESLNGPDIYDAACREAYQATLSTTAPIPTL
jgi:hypothetical protein